MSHPNTDRDERVRQTRERRAEASRVAAKSGWLNSASWSDIDYLLSLLDSQAALARELAIIVDAATDEDPGTSLSKLRKIQHDAATAMRDRCVAKVAEMKLPTQPPTDIPSHLGGSAYDAIIEGREKRNALLDEAIAVLQCLTIDQGE